MEIKKLLQHRFVRGVAVLQTGSFATGIIQALVGVFLARWLQPELFGVFALAFSLASLISIFVGAGVQDAVAQDAMSTVLSEAYVRKDRAAIKDALAFLVKITFFIAILALVGAVLAPFIAKGLYGNPKIGAYAGVIVLAVISSTFFFSLSTLVLRVLYRIRTMMLLTLSDQVARYGLSLLLVFFGFGVAGAIIGHLLGAVVIFFVSFFVWQSLKKRYSFLPSLRGLLGQAKKISVKKYLGFSGWIAADRSLSSLYAILPVLLTGIFVASSEVAFFKLAFAYINVAMSLLGPVSVLLNVEFPRMKIEDSSKLAKNFVKVSVYSLGLSAVLTAGALLVAPYAFKFFYGENFMPSVKYVYGLFAYGGLLGIGVGLGPMWRAVNKVKVSIIINAVTLGIGVPLGLFLIKNMGLWGSVVMVTLWYTVSHFVSFIFLTRVLKNKRGDEKN